MVAPPLAAIRPNQTLNGRYALLDLIGEGGMGVVYRAKDRLTQKEVALKKVRFDQDWGLSDSATQSSDPEQLRLALAKEFQTLAGLRHPNIISVLDYGFDTDRQPFFTMAHIKKSQTFLEAGDGLNFEEKIELTTQLLQGLAYLHRRGILHRDIKPENVLVSAGDVLLLDFGLSQKVQENGQMGGSPIYMAPELIEGDDASVQSDLYAVGVLFFELITGHHPFGQFDSGFYERLFHTLPKMDGANEKVHEVLFSLLAKDKEDRPKSAGAALDLLNSHLNKPYQSETTEIRESYLQSAKFVGRKSELKTLLDALMSAKNQTGSAWLLGGECGVGKSRMINELRTEALVQGFIVLEGLEAQEGSGAPFQLWREPIRHALVAAPEVDQLTASVLLALIPDISNLLQRPVSPAPELSNQANQLRLFATIATLFKSVGRPVLLTLEDLHWSKESLLPIPYLANLAKKQPWLILGSYRHDERPNLSESLPDLQHMKLNRLTKDMMAELSSAMLGEVGKRPEIIELLQSETEGNIFFAVEIARALAEDAGRLANIDQMELPKTLLPRGIQDIVDRRLAKLPESAKQLLLIAAIAGLELDLSLIDELAGDFDLHNWWLPLCAETAVLEVRQNMWHFAHSKIRDGLLAQLSLKEKIELHKLVAESLEKLHPNEAQFAAKLAYHWQQAQSVENEIHYTVLAGDYYVEQFANPEALVFYTRALQIIPNDRFEQKYRILLKRAELYNLSGDRANQFTDLTELEEIANRLNNSEKKAEVTIQKAIYFDRIGQYEHAIEAAQQIINLGERLNDQNITSEGHLIWGSTARYIGDLKTAQIHLEHSISVFRETENFNKLSHALNGLGILYSMLETKDVERKSFEESLQLAQQLGDVKLQSRLFNNLSLYHSHHENHQEARTYLEKGLNLMLAIGDRFGEAIAYQNKGIHLHAIGGYSDAFNLLKDSASIFQEINNPAGENYSLFFLGLVAEKLGRHAEFQKIVEESLSRARKQGQENNIYDLIIFLGFAHKIRGDIAQASNLFEHAIESAEPVNANRYLENAYFHQAMIFRREQNWAEADQYFCSLIERIGDNRFNRLYLPALSGLAAVRLHQGNLNSLEELIAPCVDRLLNHVWINGWHDMRMALECVKILNATKDGRAKRLISKAAAKLQDRASLLEDEEAQKFYLEGVDEHREILEINQSLLQN